MPSLSGGRRSFWRTPKCRSEGAFPKKGAAVWSLCHLGGLREVAAGLDVGEMQAGVTRACIGLRSPSNPMFLAERFDWKTWSVRGFQPILPNPLYRKLFHSAGCEPARSALQFISGIFLPIELHRIPGAVFLPQYRHPVIRHWAQYPLHRRAVSRRTIPSAFKPKGVGWSVGPRGSDGVCRSRHVAMGHARVEPSAALRDE
jgi:hypothetical protein